MKPRKHIHVKYCWQAKCLSPLERCLRHLKNIVTLKTSNIFTLTVTDEGHSRNTAWAKNKIKINK